VSLLENQEEVLSYLRARVLFNNDVEDTEEYPIGEELDDDEKPITLEILGYPETSFADFIVEMDLVKNNPMQLADYYKKLRVPKAKKFASDIKRLYQSTFSK
jgi:hypothetical protein